MYYEWDPSKERRAFMRTFLMAWLFAIAISALPICIAAKTGAL
jgi:hypothetical protein